MGKGGKLLQKDITWDTMKEHNTREDRWIAIEGQVYDISNWHKRHPGGSRVISHFAGQDGSEAFRAFHPDLDNTRKYMAPFHIGSLESNAAKKDEEMIKDFEELRQTCHKMGLFKPSVTFFLAVAAHLILLEIAAYYVLKIYGTGWIPWLISVSCYSIVQAQAGWSQHDYGHLSVFKSVKWNHWLHQFTMCFTKGAGADWWNHMHNQHHAKPNVLNKDPDVRLEAIFAVGETMPKKLAKSKWGIMPYKWQHLYFFFTLPPLLFPLYFQVMVFRHSFTRKKWLDIFVMGLFYAKIAYLYYPLLGFWGTVFYYFVMRCAESHWFVYVAQSNHIPMEIDFDKERPWIALQTYSSCNIEKSYFNDWFTGHLNFQIEHHFFPTMPRHNLYKTTPMVRSLCAKYDIPFVNKPLIRAFADIVGALKKSAELYDKYVEFYKKNPNSDIDFCEFKANGGPVENGKLS